MAVAYGQSVLLGMRIKSVKDMDMGFLCLDRIIKNPLVPLEWRSTRIVGLHLDNHPSRIPTWECYTRVHIFFKIWKNLRHLLVIGEKTCIQTLEHTYYAILCNATSSVDASHSFNACLFYVMQRYFKAIAKYLGCLYVVCSTKDEPCMNAFKLSCSKLRTNSFWTFIQVAESNATIAFTIPSLVEILHARRQTLRILR